MRGHSQVKEWHNLIWFSGGTPKYSFHLWMTTMNRLSRGDRMINWNNGSISSCIFCIEPIETRDHLFFDCPFSATIWRNISAKLLNQRYTTSSTYILSLLACSNFKTSTSFILCYLFQATVHKIWHERNRRRHGEAPQMSSQITSFIDHLIRNRISSIRHANPKCLQDGLQV